MVTTMIMFIAALAVIISFGLMIKCPKAGIYLYKGAFFIIMIIVLFVALFFYLSSNQDINALNINLHPWKNFILPRAIGATIIVGVIFGIAQIPLIFVKCYNKGTKYKIMRYEGIIYAVILAVGVILLSKYSGVGKLYDTELQAGNEVVRLINEYNKTHGKQCESLSELGFTPVKDYFYEYKGMWFSLKSNDKTYGLRFRSPDGGNINYDFIYTRETDSWSESIIW